VSLFLIVHCCFISIEIVKSLKGSSTPLGTMAPSQERSILILSSVLFAASASWMLRNLEQRRQNRSMSSRPDIRPLKTTVPPGKIGERGLRALGHNTSYLGNFLRCLQDMCDPVQNPSGHIAFCMAENKLVIDVLAERLMQRGTATAAFSDSVVYCYNSFLGLPVARQAAAYFLAKRFLFPDSPTVSPEQALYHIKPENVCLGAGAVSLLNSLFFLLGDEGDACLIPAPYYAAFESDMMVSLVHCIFHVILTCLKCQLMRQLFWISLWRASYLLQSTWPTQR
jgi:hypothetical protein